MSERAGETERAGGSVPGGIETGSVLCDQDGDDFIRGASFCLCPLSFSGCK